MKTNSLLTALVHLGALLLAGGHSKEAQVPVVPEGAQAGEWIGLEE